MTKQIKIEKMETQNELRLLAVKWDLTSEQTDLLLNSNIADEYTTIKENFENSVNDMMLEYFGI